MNPNPPVCLYSVKNRIRQRGFCYGWATLSNDDQTDKKKEIPKVQRKMCLFGKGITPQTLVLHLQWMTCSSSVLQSHLQMGILPKIFILTHRKHLDLELGLLWRKPPSDLDVHFFIIFFHQEHQNNERMQRFLWVQRGTVWQIIGHCCTSSLTCTCDIPVVSVLWWGRSSCESWSWCASFESRKISLIFWKMSHLNLIISFILRIPNCSSLLSPPFFFLFFFTWICLDILVLAPTRLPPVLLLY